MAQLFQFTRPNPTYLDKLISENALVPTYDGKLPNTPFDASIFQNPPKGFDFDDNKILLGKGEATWQAARKAMDDWAIFPDTWTWLYHQNARFTEGSVVGVLIHLFGIWWVNFARIVKVEDTEMRYGFTYCTMPQHLEMGYESFMIWRDVDGTVFYNLTAVSHPKFWGARLTYPMPRLFQKKFVRQSLSKMKKTTDDYCL